MFLFGNKVIADMELGGPEFNMTDVLFKVENLEESHVKIESCCIRQGSIGSQKKSLE